MRYELIATTGHCYERPFANKVQPFQKISAIVDQLERNDIRGFGPNSIIISFSSSQDTVMSESVMCVLCRRMKQSYEV